MEKAKVMFEIRAIREVILAKEAKGKDASFERDLLKSWSQYPGWEEAGEKF